jgi:DNA-binding response OmpR family regulator/two-component sensor histidine kinase
MNENIKGNDNEKALISRNSKNLLRLVNQLLDLSKLDSGKMTLDKIQGDIVQYLQYLTESFYSMAGEKNIRLVFYPEVEEVIMDYDEVKIQHIIYNLLSNAIKFTPKGGRVILHLNYSDATKTELQLKVKDSGIGISEDKLPFIFDRFYQADNSHTRKGEGTGIGLALTKELIELMGGNLDVKSKLDEGTSFIIHLPITRAANLFETNSTTDFLNQLQQDMVPEQNNATHTTIPKLTDQHKPEILIIEDNQDVFIYIETLLRSDYDIRYASNGQDGINTAFERIPDIIISDVMMPEKDGYEVCEILKQDDRTSHIPIILLTAKAEQDDRVQGLIYGADAYLTKPFHKEELLIRVEKLLELRRQLQLRYSEATSSVKIDLNPTKEELFIQKIKQLVEEHLEDNEFGVPELAKVALLSQMQLYRKLKALTGKTPSQFIRSIRLQKGKELLLTTDLTISEIAYDVGFSDPNYFSRTFQKEFGKSPRDMR